MSFGSLAARLQNSAGDLLNSARPREDKCNRRRAKFYGPRGIESTSLKHVNALDQFYDSYMTIAAREFFIRVAEGFMTEIIRLSVRPIKFCGAME